MIHKNVRLFILFVVTQLLQAFLFNTLTISTCFNPLVYVAFVLLLPLELSRGGLLLCGLAAGVVADWFMGTPGLNTIVTVFVAFVRPFLLDMLFGKENIREGGVPSPERLGGKGFMRYVISLVAVHHLLFFVLEALSWQLFGYTLLRLVVSAAATAGFTWLMARLFTSKLTVRI